MKKLILLMLILFPIAVLAQLPSAMPSASPLPQLPDAGSMGLLKWGLSAFMGLKGLGALALPSALGVIVKLFVDFFKTGVAKDLFSKIPDAYKILFVSGLALLSVGGAALLAGQSIGSAIMLASESSAAAVFMHELFDDLKMIIKKPAPPVSEAPKA